MGLTVSDNAHILHTRTKGGGVMKKRYMHHISIIASAIATFVIYLCVSFVDVTPVIIIVALCAAAVLFEKASRGAAFTAVKLKTQKIE
jgi:hypothetical protein